MLLATLVAGLGLAGPAQAGSESVASLEAKLKAVNQEMQQEATTLAALQAEMTTAVAELDALDHQMVDEEGLATLYGALAERTAAKRRATYARYLVVRRQYEATLHRLDGILRWADAHGSGSLLAALLSSRSLDAFIVRLHELAVLAEFEDENLRLAAAERARLQQELALLAALGRREQEEEAGAAAAAAQLRQDAALRQQEVAVLTARRAEVAALTDVLRKEASGLYGQILALEAAVQSGRLSQSALAAAVQKVAAEYGVDPLLVMAVIRQESGGNPDARSSAGALGLMQLMPGTAAMLGVTDPLNPQQNLEGGVHYLAELLQKYHGNVALALAAYNAGPAAVDRYGGIPPYSETENYVKNILSMLKNGY
jgi:soluble lytic murein transglycosylase-like protein